MVLNVFCNFVASKNQTKIFNKTFLFILNKRIINLMRRNTIKWLKLLAVIVGTVMFAACSSDDDMLPEQTDKNTPVTSNTPAPGVNVTPVLPQKDFRAVWMSTVYQLDWPNTVGWNEGTVNKQKAHYTSYLNKLQELNINAVIFQVRPMADAFYDSPYEPWSKYVSGRRGKKPAWDPLPWLISETHKRGIQFHAWINPYRIATRSGASAKFPTLESTIPAEWVKDYNTVRVYNPALPEVRQRIADIVADLLHKFDIDGIHFDDYFYPSLTSGESMNDNAEYQQYGHGEGLANFRRANVDAMITKVQETIRMIRPNCLFSVSPQGNYDNDYYTMYCDVKKWSQTGMIDVLIPQIYWSTQTYFGPRLKQFADFCTKSHFMVGYGLYRFDGTSSDPYYQTNADLKKQLDIAYANSKVKGGIFFSAKWMLSNPVKTNEVIKEKYNTLVLPPYLGVAPMVQPAAPQNVKADGMKMSWDEVSDCYYAVYRSNPDDNTATLVQITYDTTVNVPVKGNYFVTAVTKGLNAESNISSFVNCDTETSGIHHVTM